MKSAASEPWYADGLQFSCTRCGKCCTGEPGYVWVTEEELAAIAQFRQQPLAEVTQLYTRRARGRITLKEKVDGDCVFYSRESGCTVYPVRPPQCRTWPFWDSNLESPETWERTEGACPGSGQGELITFEEITRRMKVIKM
jgi:Fe-S-cluster containining protein